MSNFESIDDYLMDRLGEQEKTAFEQQLQSDASLRENLNLQKQILEGVRKARITELKSMLSNVPVGSAWSSGFTAGNIAATLVTATIVGTALYFYLRPGQPAEIVSVTTPNKEAISVPAPSDSVVTTPLTAEEPAASVPGKVRPEASKKITPTATANPGNPRVNVVDPSDELDNANPSVGKSDGQQSAITLSRIGVETDGANKKYTFHYQFREGKLVLFGTFDKSLYEILEIHGDQHAVFLFFKENYFLLNEKQDKITRLEPIRDATLLKKLKEYRGR